MHGNHLPTSFLAHLIYLVWLVGLKHHHRLLGLVEHGNDQSMFLFSMTFHLISLSLKYFKWVMNTCGFGIILCSMWINSHNTRITPNVVFKINQQWILLSSKWPPSCQVYQISALEKVEYVRIVRWTIGILNQERQYIKICVRTKIIDRVEQLEQVIPQSLIMSSWKLWCLNTSLIIVFDIPRFSMSCT